MIKEYEAILSGGLSISDLNCGYAYERIFDNLPFQYSRSGYNSELKNKLDKLENFNILCLEQLAKDQIVEEDEFGGSFYNARFYISTKKKVLIKLSESSDNVNIVICSEEEKEILDLFKSFKPCLKIKKDSEIGILCQNHSLYIRRVKIPNMNMDLELNYGSKFSNIHKKFIEILKNRKNGLAILRGNAGTGKTSYIKYLAQNSERLFLFVPVNQLDMLTSPHIMDILLNNPNVVLILEDAEKAVISREQSENASLVSCILNLTDGILSSMINLLVIITFNTSIDKIDNALKRKGRLILDHEFKELSIPDSQKVIDSLNKSYKVSKPMSLAELYNLEDDDYSTHKNDKIIGFK